MHPLHQYNLISNNNSNVSFIESFCLLIDFQTFLEKYYEKEEDFFYELINSYNENFKKYPYIFIKSKDGIFKVEFFMEKIRSIEYLKS